MGLMAVFSLQIATEILFFFATHFFWGKKLFCLAPLTRPRRYKFGAPFAVLRIFNGFWIYFFAGNDEGQILSPAQNNRFAAHGGGGE